MVISEAVVIGIMLRDRGKIGFQAENGLSLLELCFAGPRSEQEISRIIVYFSKPTYVFVVFCVKMGALPAVHRAHRGRDYM